MNHDNFCNFLIKENIEVENHKTYLVYIDAFRQFLLNKNKEETYEPDVQDINEYSKKLIETGLNTYETYHALLLYYGFYLKNNDVSIAILELLDGIEVLANFSNKISEILGKKIRDKVFHDINELPIGADNKEKALVMHKLMERLEGIVDRETIISILSNCLRTLEEEPFYKDKVLFRQCKNIDEYLEIKMKNFIKELEDIKENGTLYYSQPITVDVLDYVKSNIKVSKGIRKGNIFYETKIPYMADKYLKATNNRMKKYYYYHCPWARESIKFGKNIVSSSFCACTAGYEKKIWEVIFGQPLKAETIKSVLKGDSCCTIAIHLPECVLNGIDD